MKKLNILLADDHAVVREGLKRLIESESDMEVVGEAEDGEKTLAAIMAHAPDVVVLDISMPGLNGIEVAHRLREACPQVRVLVLTMHEDKSYSRELLDAGVLGYLLKRAAATGLIPAIRTVAAGGLSVDADITRQLVDTMLNHSDRNGMERLSERELAVLQFIAQGFSNKEVASKLKLSVKTIETYKARSMDKLRLRSRVDIVRHAIQHGWLQSN